MNKTTFVALAGFGSLALQAQALVIQDLPASALSAAQGAAAAALLEGRGDSSQSPAALAFRGLLPHSVSAGFIPMSLGRYAQSLAFSRSLSRNAALGLQGRFLSTGGVESRDAAGNLNGEFRYSEWEAGAGAAFRDRYHAAGGFMILGHGQTLAGASAGGLQAQAGVLLRPFLTYPLHLGATTRLDVIPRTWPSGHEEKSPPSGSLALGYELLPAFWAGAGADWGKDKARPGAAASWTHEPFGVSLRASGQADRLALGAGYVRKARSRVDYTFVLGLEGPSSRHLAGTEFEF